MMTFDSTSRLTIMTAGLIAAGLALAGCSKPAETPSAPDAPAVSAVTSPNLFSQPIENKMPADSTVLAVVNGTEITVGQFNKEMEVMMSRMQGRVPPERMGQMQAQMRDQLLDNMVTRQVLIDKVKADNIEVSPADFDEAVETLTSTLPPGVSLNDMLAQTGMSEEEFRKTLMSELQIRKLIEANTDTSKEITDEELLAFYNENAEQFTQGESVAASHILIGTEPTDTPEVKEAKRQELEAIRQQILEGGDFAALAGEHSSCPSRAQGGDLGRFERGRMVPAFEQAAFSQNVGEIGEIVETQFGYHLIKVTDRSEAGATPLEEVKEQLSSYLSNQKQQKGIQEYVEGLKESADVKFPGTPAAN